MRSRSSHRYRLPAEPPAAPAAGTRRLVRPESLRAVQGVLVLLPCSGWADSMRQRARELAAAPDSFERDKNLMSLLVSATEHLVALAEGDTTLRNYARYARSQARR